MFHYDGGLKLTRADLAVDFRRRQPRAFVSHAHSDHIARHAYALCTPTTSRLYQHRLGRRRTLDMPYGQTIQWGGLRLTTYPAGHCAGSAMLLADDGEQTLLYTGDFKLGPSATAEPAQLPRADILVMECTFGDPRYRMPPWEETVVDLVRLVREALAARHTPVIHAYVLGKAQEVTRLLTQNGIHVLQHRDVFLISQIYERCGIALGNYGVYDGRSRGEFALVVPPGKSHLRRLGGLEPLTTFAVTGWAAVKSTRSRLGVDHALPLSDHADYDQLLEAAAQVAPREIYCTHGPECFVGHLRRAGFMAFPLGKSYQARLFD